MTMSFRLVISLHAPPNKHLKLFVIMWNCCCCCWYKDVVGAVMISAGTGRSGGDNGPMYSSVETQPQWDTDQWRKYFRQHDHLLWQDYQRWKWTHFTEKNCQSMRRVTFQKRSSQRNQVEHKQVSDEIILLLATNIFLPLPCPAQFAFPHQSEWPDPKL